MYDAVILDYSETDHHSIDMSRCFFSLLVGAAIIIVTCQKKPKAWKVFYSHGYLCEHSTDRQQYEWTV